MQEYLPQGNWSMAAILGLDDNTIEEVCKKVTSGFVVPAIIIVKVKLQFLVKSSCRRSNGSFKTSRAKRAIELKTSDHSIQKNYKKHQKNYMKHYKKYK